MSDINVPELGNAIADEMETHGHWQGHAGPQLGVGARCIITARVYPVDSEEQSDAFLEALYRKIDLAVERDVRGHLPVGPAINWNDTTESSVVVKTLRDLDA